MARSRPGEHVAPPQTEPACEQVSIPSSDHPPLRCLDCASAIEGPACLACNRPYPERDGIREAIGPLIGRNRIAATFYNGPGWQRFRRWEQLFLRFQGGPTVARRAILRHLRRPHRARVLEVGIGDGGNLSLLPPSWFVSGVDIARNRLVACQQRFPAMKGRLAWAEAEALPFGDAAFDATYTVGGFNFFRDHRAALREMRRVTRPGGVLVVADEIGSLFRLAPGHVLGFPGLDSWALYCMGLDAEFVDMVLACRLDIDGLIRDEFPPARRYAIWNRLGYCWVTRS
jgi:SAM-dependent methyltransferase